MKSIIERHKSMFNASVAEVDLNDKWQRAVIGISCVSNEAGHADSMMANIFVDVMDLKLVIVYFSHVL